jgi:hypothetical protein
LPSASLSTFESLASVSIFRNAGSRVFLEGRGRNLCQRHDVRDEPVVIAVENTDGRFDLRVIQDALDLRRRFLAAPA